MALTQKQIDELNIAASRLGTANESPQDRANIEYAQRTYGFRPTGNTSPSITRDGAGYKIAETPSYKFNLEDFKNKTTLSEAAKNIIQKKQNFNKDIQGAREWVRTVGADTSPFGGMRDQGLEMAGMFTDERMRQLSPEDQASIRASRGSALQAYGQGLTEEAKYRATRVDDVLKVFSDLYDQYRERGADERDAKRLALDEARYKMDMLKTGSEIGYTLDANGNPVRNLSGATAEQIANAIKQVESGGNYEARGGSGEFGAYQFMPGTWNGWVNEFAKSQGQGPMSLPMTQANQDMIAKWKIQQWLDQGLSPQQIAAKWNSGSEFGWENKRGTNAQGVKYDVPAYVNKVTGVLSNLVPTSQNYGIEITDAQKLSILKSFGSDENGKPVISISDTAGWTADDWIAAQSSVRQAQIEQAVMAIGEWTSKQTLTGSQIFAKLQKEYGGVLSSADLNSVMVGAGYQNTGDIFSGTWEKTQ